MRNMLLSYEHTIQKWLKQVVAVVRCIINVAEISFRIQNMSTPPKEIR